MVMARATTAKRPMLDVDQQVGDGAAASRTFSPLTVGVVGIAAVAAIYGSVTSAYVQVMRRIAPDAVLRFDTDDASSLNRKNLARLSDNKQLTNSAARARISRDALRSARAQFLNPHALGHMALMLDFDGKQREAFPLFAAASKLSRRGHFTELWLGNYYLTRGKTAQAIGHFDKLLKVAPSTAQVINPMLTTAMGDRANIAAFQPLFEKPAPWFGGFLRHAMRDEKAVVVLGDILTSGTKLPDTPVYRAIQSETLGWLVQRDDFARARKLLATQGKDAAAVATSLSFSKENRNSNVGPFAWNVGVSEGLAGGFEGNDAGPPSALRFRASARSLSSGVALAKTFTVAPGRYRFLFGYEVTDQGQGATASWRILCLGKAPLIDVPIDLVREKGVTSATVSIPVDCRAQQLQLLMNGGDIYPGLELLLTPPTISKAVAKPAG
jgi:tetratricopeptide (TPR) repeat protein